MSSMDKPPKKRTKWDSDEEGEKKHKKKKDKSKSKDKQRDKMDEIVEEKPQERVTAADFIVEADIEEEMVGPSLPPQNYMLPDEYEEDVVEELPEEPEELPEELPEEPEELPEVPEELPEEQSNEISHNTKSPTPPPKQPNVPKPVATFLDYPTLAGCRSVEIYEKLNRIEEGSYGVVYRARDRETGEIVALKRLKLSQEKTGFPITSLREIQALLLSKHPNIVNVKEIVVGEQLTSIFIVMEFVEHDIKALMETMKLRKTTFSISEVKTIMLQLLSATKLLHDNWIIHRDLKTSNLLMNNRGQIKVADFGLARRFGSPMSHMTQLVVTLWYRAPELLLGSKDYTTAIDVWSIGCIFAELLDNEPLIAGQGEIEQLVKMFTLLGVPTEHDWPEVMILPNARALVVPSAHKGFTTRNLKSRYPKLSKTGLDLLARLLTYDPKRRITAAQALQHPFFDESPLPKDPTLFPSWPSVAAGEKRKIYSPSAPHARDD